MGVDQKAFPQYLYKFRADNDFTAKIFTDNELWFSNPLDFNDPYDCSTPINIKTPLSEIKKWLISVGVHQLNVDELAKKLQKNPNLMKDSTEKALREMGVCCFTTRLDSILQWSHYADYHKGLSLKFDITEHPDFFTIPIIVSYRNVMQHYNHFCHSNRIVEYLIQPKSTEWSYESEIRVVKSSNNIKTNGGNRAFKFKDSALKEVVFGAKTPDTVIDKYKKLCAIHNKGHVQFSKMELGSGTHYELVKKAI